MDTDIFSLHGKAELENFLEDTENKLLYINKRTTRIGATTTYTNYLCEYATRENKTLLVLEPTNAIIEGTVIPAHPEIFWLRKNEDLCSNAEVKRKYKHFIKVFGYLPTSECNRCVSKDECERPRISAIIPEKNLIATTYAKVYFDKRMLKLINPDIILMDEFQWIDKFEVNKFTTQELTSILEDFRYVQTKGNNFLNTNEGVLLVEYLEDVTKGEMNVQKEFKYAKLKTKHFLNARNAIVKRDEKRLFDRFAKAWHSYHRFNYYGEEVMIPNYKTPIEYIMEQTKAKVLIISMSQFQNWMFKDYSNNGKKVLTIDLHQPPNERSQLVICDSGSRPLMWYASRKPGKYNEEIKTIESVVKTLDSFVPLKNALIFAPNKDVRKKLNNKLGRTVKSIESFADVREGNEGNEAFLDHARSSTSGGIETGKRLGVLINLPWTPAEAFNDRELVSGIPKKALRDDEISYALKNCLGRLKDPRGIKPSIVFIYGARKKDVLEFYPEKEEIVEIRQRRGVGGVKSTLSEVTEYVFLWRRLFNSDLDKAQYMRYVKVFYDIDIPAIHSEICNKVKEGEDAKFSDFDFHIKDLDKWHRIENDKDVLSILGIERSGDVFSLRVDLLSLVRMIDKVS